MIANTINILIIDNDTNHLSLFKKSLSVNSNYKITSVDNFTDALLKLQEQLPDLIFSRINLNDGSLNNFFLNSYVQRLWPEIKDNKTPTIVLYNSEDELNDIEHLQSKILDSFKAIDSICKQLSKLVDLYIHQWNQNIECNCLEHAIDISSAHYKSILNAIPKGICLTYADETIFYANTQFAQILSINNTKDLIDVKLETIILAEDYHLLSSAFTKTLTNEIRLIKSDGTIMYSEFSISPIKDSKDNIVYYMYTFGDQSDKKWAEEKIEMLMCAVDQSPVSIVITDLEGNIEYVNPKCTEVTGYETDEIIGKNPRVLKSGEMKADNYKELWDTIIAGKQWTGEFHNKKKNGTLYWEKATISPIIINNKQLHYLAIKEDTTKQKEYEKALVIAKNKAEESDKLKSAFLSNMSHEIRTPMNGIMGFAELLARDQISSDKKHYYSESIIKCTKQLLGIVNDIIDLSKIETGQVNLNQSLINLTDVLTELAQNYTEQANERKLELTINKSQSNGIIMQADRGRLLQILNNIIGNAFKFTYKGSINIDFTIKQNFIEFSISDTGIGIATEHHHKLFGRFQQAHLLLSDKFGGTGLGLAISRSLVNLMGGEIWFKSTLGKGSTFYFTIPLLVKTNEKQIIETNSKIEETPSNKNLKILVADDDEINTELLKEVLEGHGHKIYIATNGLEAVKIFKTIQLDLILMDIKMPLMNGLEATRIIKSTNSIMPVIALTAFAMNDDKEQTIKAGCDDYMTKPINIKELIALVSKYQKLQKTEK